MATVPQITQSFILDTSDSTLDALADRAYLTLGACGGRLAKAVALVRADCVTLLDHARATVQSQSIPGHAYAVNGTCPCEDAQRLPDGRCKHRLAVALARRMVLPEYAPLPPDTGCQVPTDQDGTPCHAAGHCPHLPEAPASVNVRVQVQGREVQVTLRDVDEGRLLARLAALLGQFPVETSTTVATPSVQAEGWCAVHGVQMRRNVKEGRTWWSHKIDGAWCKGKYRRHQQPSARPHLGPCVDHG